MITTAKLKQDKLARDNLKITCNRIKSEWSFKKLKTYEDLLLAFGFSKEWILQTYRPLERLASIDYQDVKDFISDRQVELDTKIWLENNPPIITYTDDELQSLKAKDAIDLLLESNIELRPEKDFGPSPNSVPKDYGLEPSEKETCSLLWFQKKYAKEILDGIRIHKKTAQYLIAKPGDGKTFIAGAVFRRLIDSGFQATTSNKSPWPYIYVTKASVVEQVKYDFLNEFGLTMQDVLVIGIDQLRSKFGELFVNEKMHIVAGKEVFKWEWRKYINPLVIVWDESHILKNPMSTQSSIAQSFNDITDETYQIFSSATPGVRVQDFICFAVATKVKYQYGPLTNKTWGDFAKSMCRGFRVKNKDGQLYEAQPQDYCQEAVARLREYLKDYIVRVKGVKSQFKAHNEIKLLHFQNEDEKMQYERAVEEMMEKMAKLHAKEGLNKSEIRLQEITILLYFRMKAEIIKAPLLAKMMYKSVNGYFSWHPGKKFAALCALNFKQSVAAIVKILVNDYNVPRNLISLTWGGGNKVNKKAKLKGRLLLNKEVMDAFEEQGITMDDLDLDIVEAKMEEELEPELRLGIQSKQQREYDKMQFLAGKTLYHIFTYKAGGAGLSLHHTDRFTKEKVRHKESGYAVEEDIPKIPTRQRIVFGASSWSPFEIAQGFGRAPRITSLSDSYQYLIYYANTVEARVAGRASMALTCLAEFIQQNESWEDLIVGREPVRRVGSTEEDEDGTDGYFDSNNEDDDKD